MINGTGVTDSWKDGHKFVEDRQKYALLLTSQTLVACTLFDSLIVDNELTNLKPVSASSRPDQVYLDGS